MTISIFITFAIIGLIEFYSNKSIVKYNFIPFIATVSFFLLFFWNLSYFTDKYNYEVMFDNIDAYNTDFLYTTFVKFWHKNNWDFDKLYRFHILIISIFFASFIFKFTRRGVFVVLIICCFRFVDFGNQIRYFFGFFIALNALYYFIVGKKYLLASILGVISILSHSSLIILYIIPLLYKWISQLTIKKILLLNILILTLLGIITTTVLRIFPQFSKYLLNENLKSSFWGGLFDIFPIIFIIWAIFQRHTFFVKNGNMILEDKKYKFLFTISNFAFLFISMGIFYRIFNDRLVFSFSLVWLCYFIYCFEKYPPKKSLYQKNKIILLFSALIGWFYFATYFVLGRNYYLEEALLMLNIK